VRPYDQALRLLAVRPHFRRELALKLARREFSREEIDEALDRLAAEGYLDDRRTARDFVAHRQEKGGEGWLRLKAELVKRGAAAEAVEEALAGISAEDDLDAARDAAARWSRSGREDAAALARHLGRKGFSRRAIVAVLKERPGGPEEPEELLLDGDDAEQ
jgi:regulatory protein